MTWPGCFIRTSLHNINKFWNQTKTLARNHHPRSSIQVLYSIGWMTCG
jgi:hypothetical protein